MARHWQIIATKKAHIPSFRRALDRVAKEGRYLSLLKAPALPFVRSFVGAMLERGQPHFVAIAKGEVVGWCDVAPMDRPVHAHCGLLGIGIVAEYREQGIGGALMQTTLDRAQEIGLQRIELDVREDNKRAIALYERFGFQTEGIKRKSSLQDGVYGNDIVMGLIFQD